VLSNVIVKGRFADHNVPKELQRIIIAESGANDGLGYPFLFFALYLIRDLGEGGGGPGKAMGDWFGETWGYTIVLSVVVSFLFFFPSFISIFCGVSEAERQDSAPETEDYFLNWGRSS
jgi:NhaP-type Na+/H+ or K+/H+ antiporter